MGYSTTYRLKVGSMVLNETPEQRKAARKGLKATKIYDGYSTLGALMTEGMSAKWYEWQTEMREISKRFPSLLFKLSGEGEEGGDLWRAYFVDGKMQEAPASIRFEKFDPAKLA